MNNVSVNTVRLDSINVNTIRLNSIGVPSGHKKKESEWMSHIVAIYSGKGRTNEDANRTILPDLSGNGHDIELKNLSYNGNSGFGQYNMNLTFDYSRASSVSSITYKSIKVIAKTYSEFLTKQVVTNGTNNNTKDYPQFEIKINSILDYNNSFSYTYINENGNLSIFNINKNDKIVTIPKSYNSIAKGLSNVNIYFSIGSNSEVEFEIVPEYEGALCSDGIDDYGICNNFPIFNTTDGYTVIAKRKYINSNVGTLNKKTTLLSKSATFETGAFITELVDGTQETLGLGVYSFSRGTTVHSPGDIIYQTSKSYCGTKINIGNALDTNSLFLGTIRLGDSRKFDGALYDLIILDKDYPQETIEEIIKYFKL